MEERTYVLTKEDRKECEEKRLDQQRDYSETPLTTERVDSLLRKYKPKPKNKTYSLKIDEELQVMKDIILEAKIDLNEMIRKFINDVYMDLTLGNLKEHLEKQKNKDESQVAKMKDDKRINFE